MEVYEVSLSSVGLDHVAFISKRVMDTKIMPPTSYDEIIDKYVERRGVAEGVCREVPSGEKV